MPFNPIRSRASQPPRAPRVVFAVGRRVFVQGPADCDRPVALTDERGDPVAAGFRDGAEVEVLAWRPRGSAGTRYRVRASQGGIDGWLGADELRAGPIRPVAAVTSPVLAVRLPESAGRPFGSRG